MVEFFMIEYEFLPLEHVLDNEIGTKVRCCGRIDKIREYATIIFVDLSNFYKKVQVILHKKQDLDIAFPMIKKGDIVKVMGDIQLSKTGQKSLFVDTLNVIKQCKRDIPDSWKGIVNVETKFRDPCLNIIVNSETRKNFSRFMKATKLIRTFYEKRGFMEVETPVLQNVASGAMAQPFTTYHNKLHTNFELRIAPEIMLKKLIISGVPRVFEMAKCFRNEGMSPRHLQEFTMLEAYAAYLSYSDLKTLVIDCLAFLVYELGDTNFTTNDIRTMRHVTYSELLKEHFNYTLEEFMNNKTLLINIATQHNITHHGTSEEILERMYKGVIIPTFTKPILIDKYPIMPLAKNASKYESMQFQILIDNKEIVKACQEEDSSEQQLIKFKNQEDIKAHDPDAEIANKDDQFIQDMKLGMPPTCGLGIGINRLVQVLYGLDNIRETVLWPLMNSK